MRGLGVPVVSPCRTFRDFQEISRRDQALDGLPQGELPMLHHRDDMTEARQVPALPATSRMIRAGNPPPHLPSASGP